MSQPENVSVSVTVGDVKVQFSGTAESVMASVFNFLSKQVPAMDLAKRISLSYEVNELVSKYAHLVKITPEGPRIIPDSDVRLSDKVVVKGGMTCRGLLETLWLEGYFASEKSLGDVHEELARKGYNYDRTAVSHSLTDMVRENIMTRNGTMRNYRYIQKRPPGDATG